MIPPPAARSGTGLRVWPVALAALAVWCVAVAVNLPLKLDHDESYFLASGRILNQGARLYADWIDFNTTAPSSIGRFSAWFAGVIGAPLDTTHKWTILLLAASALAVAFGVMTPALRKPGPARWVLGAGIPFVLLFATPELGRREQMVCIGLMGWIALISMAAYGVKRPRYLEMLAGLAAGLALYEKPHFALFGLVLGVIDLIRAGGRPQRMLTATWIAAGISLGLYLWLILANPDFLKVILPATVDLYSPLGIGWQASMALLMQGAGLPAAAAGMAAVALTRQARTRPPVLVIATSIAFIVSAGVIYIQQGFGFEYHRLPLDIALSITSLGLIAWGLSDPPVSLSRASHLGGIAAAIVLCVTMTGSRLEFFARYPHRDVITTSSLLERMRPPHPGDPILVIATDLYPVADALTHLDVRWSSDFMSFFPIASLIRQNDRDGLRAPLPEAKRRYWTDWFRGRVARVFCNRLPVRVLVETTDRPTFFQNAGFDMLAWLREDSAFDACWLRARLLPTGEPITFDRYRYQSYDRS